MNIEKEIFSRSKLNIDSLIKYGFIKNSNNYEYSKIIMDSLKVIITIDEKENIIGKIYDLNTNYEYTNFRIENLVGEFANNVREQYEYILRSIKDNCFTSVYFNSKQANRITEMIINIYHDKPEFPWEKCKGDGIFKNKNGKWYGIIMNINSKIDNIKGKIEVLNVKLSEDEIPNLLNKNGIYPAYHMNKKHWVTIILNDTLTDEEIMNYLSISHKYTEKSNEWIVPANPKFYDLITDFKNRNIIEWKQSNDIKVGDIVYLYVAKPYSAILYKCEALEVNIPYEYKDNNLSIKHLMKIKLLKEYDKNEYTFDKLNEFGIKAIRGPRSVPEKLSKFLN